jgi:7,8-dihydroneopterin aldolase/epimerase/oxygenase
MTTVLSIENIECYAYHGCLPEETKIGGRFSVDVLIDSDFTKAMDNDDLSATADYVLIHQIVREEMAIPSKLIEHAAGRLLKRFSGIYSQAANIVVTVKKFNPPVNGFIGTASFRVALH